MSRSPAALLVSALSLCITANASAAEPTEFPDLSTVAPDLTVPALAQDAPAPGRRVRHVLPGDEATDVYHTLYLPADWSPERRWPVFVEYPGNGNYRNAFGDVSDGRPEGCVMGYGLTAGRGAIWVCLPFVQRAGDRQSLAITWWGDVAATKDYCRQTIDLICERFGGDRRRIVLAGFSRGAIAANYIGLNDDEIARTWCGFLTFSHYDGVRRWPYADSDRDSALVRLRRLGARPQFIAAERTIDDIRDYLQETGVPGAWTWQPIPFRNHNAGWVLRDVPARRAAREWLQATWRAAEAPPTR